MLKQESTTIKTMVTVLISFSVFILAHYCWLGARLHPTCHNNQAEIKKKTQDALLKTPFHTAAQTILTAPLYFPSNSFNKFSISQLLYLRTNIHLCSVSLP